MEFNKIIERALDIRKKYTTFEKEKYGKEWTRENLVQGLVGDVGDLVKLTMAKEGVRDVDGVDEKLAHELSDCLWSICVIADKYNVDLEKSFTKEMDYLEEKLK
jgi:NTP pyrophosphatase (non-canonical NTP hydrolase)